MKNLFNESNVAQNSIEKKEKIPFNTIVLIQRHGPTLYAEWMKAGFKEQFNKHPNELTADNLDLTKPGINVVKESAHQLLNEKIINKESDVLVLVTSPQLRAISTALIDLAVLREKGVNIVFPREDYFITETLRQRGVVSEKNIPDILIEYSNYRKSIATKPQLENSEHMHRLMSNVLSKEEEEIFSEKYENIENRFQRLLRHLFNLHQTLNIKDVNLKSDLEKGIKRLVILCVTHAEVPLKFMEKTFPDYKFGLENGQFMQINQDKNKLVYHVTLYPKGLSEIKREADAKI